MGRMSDIHLETQELIGVVGDALRANDFDPFDAAGDVADQMVALGWKSPTEVAAERREMLELLLSINRAVYNYGPLSGDAEVAKAWVLMKVIDTHKFTAEELGIGESVPA